MVMFFAPLLGATLIAGALTIDKFHHWYDVVAGAIIGTFTAIVAFRQTFASVFDFRFNHLLLPRTTSIFHRTPFMAQGMQRPFFSYHPGGGMGVAGNELGGEHLPFTREGGWGWGDEAFVGAPFDATTLMGGVSGGGGGYKGGLGNNGYGGAMGRAEAGVSQTAQRPATNGAV